MRALWEMEEDDEAQDDDDNGATQLTAHSQGFDSGGGGDLSNQSSNDS